MFKIPYKIDDVIETCLDMEYLNVDDNGDTKWFSGIIIRKDWNPKDENINNDNFDSYQICVLRDDGIKGSGCDSSWEITVDKKNLKHIRSKEWDSEVNHV